MYDKVVILFLRQNVCIDKEISRARSHTRWKVRIKCIEFWHALCSIWTCMSRTQLNIIHFPRIRIGWHRNAAGQHSPLSFAWLRKFTVGSVQSVWMISNIGTSRHFTFYRYKYDFISPMKIILNTHRNRHHTHTVRFWCIESAIRNLCPEFVALNICLN